jgi:molybdopterin-guanine dinucleotide biosynthesis protein A
MPVTERTLGVLVAGGAGERLGLGLPKARVTVGGITLLERALRTLAPVCDDLVVAAPASVALPLPAGVSARGGDAPRRVEDLGGARGPLAGMLAGLSCAPFGRSLVLGVDFPCMETAFLAALLERLPERPPERPGDFQALVPAPGGIAQPMAAAYAPAAVPILAARHASGEAAPSRALRSLAVQLLEDAAIARLPGGPDCLFNLNTAADRSEAERRLAVRAASR